MANETPSNITTQKLLDFINASPVCFYAVENVRRQLLSSGFTELREADAWKLSAGGKYFVIRNGTSIISFAIPETVSKDKKPAPLRFVMTSSHSDSPCFKVKESPELKAAGVTLLNTEKYGGLLMSPWFDRPLSIAGRVVFERSGKTETSLINFDRDLLMIPNLAIHFNRDANDGHSFNVQNEMMPVISSDPDFNLKKMLAEKLCLKPEEADITGYDLFLYNRDKGAFWGADDEFISSPRLDDLECVWTTLQGFITACGSSNNCKADEDKILVHCVFDNEEVGSQSRQGAASTFLQETLRRINFVLGRNEEDYYRAVSRSFMVSADNAHAVHPNYAGSSDPVNQPKLNGGPVIKFNASQKYTSDAVTAAEFKKACKTAGVPFQIFTNNSNVAGGSTLGNISTSQVSVPTVDIGIAQWAMHSPMESAGAADPDLMIKAISALYCSC